MTYFIAIVVGGSLFVAVFILMQFVQELLISDIRLSLSEIVNQNKDVITGKLSVELSELSNVANIISAKAEQVEDLDDEQLKGIFIQYATENEIDSFYFANAKGEAFSSTGQEVNVSGRKYFQLALAGEANISEQTISRFTGEDIFVISVPIYGSDGIIGTLQRQYPPKEMYDLCSVSLFSQKGSMVIINQEGYILISSEHDSYNESSNYYRIIYLYDPEQSTLLQQNIQAKKSGFMEINRDGRVIFSAYTPIDKIHDWYLITSIDTNVIIPNVNSVIRLFYSILLLVSLSFAIILFYNLQLKHKQRVYLENLAFVDNVTGGNTFTKFESAFPSLVNQSSNGEHYYLLSFDIDSFRYINRFYGFETGDEILKTVYQLCSAELQDGEMLARVSSDRFVALLKDANAPWLKEILCDGVTIHEINIYFSSGIYPIKDRQESVNIMLDKATLASADVKGRRFKQIGLFSASFDDRLAKMEQLKQEIDKALITGEFIPYFQPKVDIYNNRLVGAEALARWIKADGTIISPGEFIPISEQTGIIRLIDWAIFSQTLAFIRKNLDQGVACVPISVNFSKVHLFDEDFIPTLQAKLEEYQIPGGLIEIELTETTIFDHADDINHLIEELHRLDLVVSMDDFGSGYSSLYMLKEVNIDILKIDQGFLSSATGGDKQQIILETIIQMSKKLKLKTVVEGVETAHHVAAMKKAECAVAQGYFYAKPMKEEVFEVYYQKGKME